MNLQGYFKRVSAHTITAIQRWGYMDRGVTKSTWNQVLGEEYGKLQRCCNKLSLATDQNVRAEWEKEAKHRLVTIASVCARFHDVFEQLPDADTGHVSDKVTGLHELQLKEGR